MTFIHVFILYKVHGVVTDHLKLLKLI